MVDTNQDTSKSTAPVEGTPEQTGAPVASESQPAEAASGSTTEARKYAGKFDSPEKLEEAYQNLQSKLGERDYAGSLGQKVVEATGYSIQELEQAGYKPEDIVQAVISPGANSQVQPVQSPTTLDPTTALKSAVESSKVDSVKFELELERLYRKNPEAEGLDDWIRKFAKHPDYKGKPAKEIYDELVPIMRKGEEAAVQTAHAKTKAGMVLSNEQAPTPTDFQKAKEAWQKTGHIDDAQGMVAAFLARNKK